MLIVSSFMKVAAKSADWLTDLPKRQYTLGELAAREPGEFSLKFNRLGRTAERALTAASLTTLGVMAVTTPTTLGLFPAMVVIGSAMVVSRGVSHSIATAINAATSKLAHKANQAPLF